ncbi:MAG: hypothetical protein ACFCVE_11815 [Phycisphaerae bacterium]
MAAGKGFACDACGERLFAWDEGNPYYLDERGQKQYAYHPAPERDQCIGNESPTLCLNCGERFMIDSQSPTNACAKCDSQDIADEWNLDGKPCPFCHGGTFRADPKDYAIS